MCVCVFPGVYYLTLVRKDIKQDFRNMPFNYDIHYFLHKNLSYVFFSVARAVAIVALTHKWDVIGGNANLVCMQCQFLPSNYNQTTTWRD